MSLRRGKYSERVRNLCPFEFFLRRRVNDELLLNCPSPYVHRTVAVSNSAFSQLLSSTVNVITKITLDDYQG
jgi:hypothetical protein